MRRDLHFPTRLQILRNYSNAISKAGGTVIFERHNSEFGYYSFTSPTGVKVWVKISPIRTGNSYKLIITEQQEMRQDIVIDANLLSEKLILYGKVALAGIYFDHGKETIKKESEPAINEPAKYLKAHLKVNCSLFARQVLKVLLK